MMRAFPHVAVARHGVTSFPATAPDGQSIVFERADAGLWQIGLDGQNPRAVKNTIGALRPTMTPDGKWILYGLQSTGVEKLWKVPADGGAVPTPMLDTVSYRPAVSPDGTLVAFYYQERPGSWDLLAVMPFDGDRPTHTFKVSPSLSSATVRWTADGKALLHNSAIGDRANIWLQPLSGSSPRQVTRFVDQNILGFDRSTDGKHLIVARGILNRDAVMIRNFR
jgi:Tol biopolymer transport system component